MYAINKIYPPRPHHFPALLKWMAEEKCKLTQIRDKKKILKLSICDNWKAQMFEIQRFSDDRYWWNDVKFLTSDSVTWVINSKTDRNLEFWTEKCKIINVDIFLN